VFRFLCRAGKAVRLGRAMASEGRGCKLSTELLETDIHDESESGVVSIRLFDLTCNVPFVEGRGRQKRFLAFFFIRLTLNCNVVSLLPCSCKCEKVVVVDAG
jgi:hypothetical protein